jgi:hypothetical protein
MTDPDPRVAELEADNDELRARITFLAQQHERERAWLERQLTNTETLRAAEGKAHAEEMLALLPVDHPDRAELRDAVALALALINDADESDVRALLKPYPSSAWRLARALAVLIATFADKHPDITPTLEHMRDQQAGSSR